MTKSGVIDLYNSSACIYTNTEFAFSLSLPCEKGWVVTPLNLKGNERHMLLNAIHQGKLVDIVVTCEPVNADLEDYLFSIKAQLQKKQENDPDKRWLFQILES
ncbi:MAG: hypothetical protein ABIA63_15030, partial [bacterium]